MLDIFEQRITHVLRKRQPRGSAGFPANAQPRVPPIYVIEFKSGDVAGAKAEPGESIRIARSSQTSLLVSHTRSRVPMSDGEDSEARRQAPARRCRNGANETGSTLAD